MKKNSRSFPALKRFCRAICLLTGFLLSHTITAQNVLVSGAVSGNGSYPDLRSAFTAINSGLQTSATINVSILASTTETAPAVLNAGAWTSLSIMPSGGNYTVSGNLAAPLVDLNGADNVSMNGLNSGGNALTVSNTNTGNALTTSLRLVADAVNNSISNCTFLGSAASATLGVITFSTGSSVGNSSNTVSGCIIGPAGTNLPVNGIYSSGSSGFNNASNAVLNCRVFDFYSAQLVSVGILIGANNSDWNISGNHLYQTGLRTFTTANTLRGIQVSSGNSCTISSNLIGYSSPFFTGSFSMTATVATRFIAIDLAVGTTGAATSVQGNTVTAITLTTTSGAATTNGILCGINVTAGNVNIGTLSGNLIGGTSGVDLMAAVPTTAQGMVVGIHSSSTGSIAIHNNFIGGLSSSGTTAALSGGLAGISISGAAAGLTITSNVIGNGSADNLRGGTNGLTTGASPVSGINLSAALVTALVTIGSNTVQNLSSYGTAAGGYVRGLWTGTGATSAFLVANNVFSNLRSNNANVTVGSGQIGTAAIILSSGNTSTITGNAISNVDNTNGGTTAIVSAGIVNANGTNTVIRYNRIYNIANQCTGTGAPGVAAGILLRSGNLNLTVFNNMISLGTGQPANISFVGIWGNHGSAPNPNDLIYFNTINIEGTVASGAQPSFGFMRGDFTTSTRTASVDIRNNLVTNTRSGGTGAHCAIGDNYGNAASPANWGATGSNYNVLNASPATIGWWGSAQTFAGWKTATGCDANSFSGIAVTYSNPATNLHLNMGLTPTSIESGGQAIAAINNDIDSQARPGPSGSVNGGALFPDIGADEIDAVPRTCTVTSGGTISPSSLTACSGQTLSAISPNASYALGTSYQWQVGTSPGGPYSNITTGLGITTISHTSAPLPAGVYYVVLRATCASASLTSVSNEVTLTVNSTPSVSASSTTTFICSSQSISLSGSPGSATAFSWSGPNSFSSTSQNTVIGNASINASGNYSFTSVVNGCASAPAIVSITVNAKPSTLTLTPLSATICAGGSQTMAVTGGNVPGGVMSFTPQTNQNTATTYPAPYSVYWGGQKMQFLVLASELSAAGIVPGPLTSIHFPVASLGANWGTSIYSCENFQVSLGLTSASSLGATFQTGLTVVSSVVNHTPTAGLNAHNFSPTFVWDGTSNLLVETLFSNNITGSAGDAVISYNSPTTFQSTMIYRADGQTFAAIAAATTTNEPANLVRPDFIIKGQMPGTFTWSPATGLSSTSGATVNATLAVTSVYSVMVSTGLCSTSVSGSINVAPLPTLAIASTASAVCAGGQATLTASGATSYTWSASSTAGSIVVAPSQSTVYTLYSQTAPCPIVSASLNFIVNPLPVVLIVPLSPTVCALSPASFTASGASSYSWISGSAAATETVIPASSSVYTVTGTDALGCSSSATVGVTTNSLPVIAVAPAGATVCLLSQASFTASGANSYSWSTGGQNAAVTVTATASGAYSVTGVNAEGCAATQAVSLTALALPNVAVTPSSPTICVNESLSLSASGAGSYTWMPVNKTTSSISVSPGTTSTYSVTGRDLNNCSNTATLSVVVSPCTGIGENTGKANGISVYPNPNNGLFFVDLGPEAGPAVLEIYNAPGQLVATQQVSGHSSLDLENKDNGIYIVCIRENGRIVKTVKLIKQ